MQELKIIFFNNSVFTKKFAIPSSNLKRTLREFEEEGGLQIVRIREVGFFSIENSFKILKTL